MIIYSVIARAGMIHMVNDLINFTNELDKKSPFTLLVFSEKMPTNIKSDKILWVKMEEDASNSNYSYKYLHLIHKKRFEKTITGINVKWIISSGSILRYFSDTKCKFCFDAIFLTPPLHQAIKKTHGFNLIGNIYEKYYQELKKLERVIPNAIVLERYMIKKASSFLAYSNNSIKYLHKHYRGLISNKKAFYIPFCPSHIERKEIDYPEGRFKFSKKPPYTFLFFGRFNPTKGIHFLVSNDWRPHQLILKTDRLLGDVNYEYLRSRGIKLITQRLSLNQLKSLIKSADAVIFPCIYEALGLALMESLSYGKICFAHDNGSGHNEQIKDGVNGFLIDMQNPDWFSTVLTKLSMLGSNELSSFSPKPLKPHLSVNEINEKRLKFFHELKSMS